MEIVKFLEEAAIESIKADAALDAICEKIQSHVRELINKKYRNDKFVMNEMQFEFYKSVCEISNWRVKEYIEPIIDVGLIYFCVSKLPKIKREKIENAKIRFHKNYEHFFSTHDSIKPLWYHFRFTADVRSILYDDLDFDCRPK